MDRIYCVEDDESIRELVLYALQSSGFETAGFEDGKSFWNAMEEQQPSLVLLDVMLPGIQDGISILRELRQNSKTCRIPVIMVTAKAAEYDRVKGLDAGADDYIPKPFGVMELVSRVRAVLRRTQSDLPDGQPLTLDKLSLDPARRLVTVQGEAVNLTFKEFELLSFLLRNQGLVLSRERMMEMVWGFDFEGESRTVDMHIKSLRQKLGRYGELIHTIRGVGYKIMGD